MQSRKPDGVWWLLHGWALFCLAVSLSGQPAITITLAQLLRVEPAFSQAPASLCPGGALPRGWSVNRVVVRGGVSSLQAMVAPSRLAHVRAACPKPSPGWGGIIGALAP